MDATQTALEALYPPFLADRWSVQQLADSAGVTRETARVFVEQKRSVLAQRNDRALLRHTRGIWPALEERIEIDRRRLEELNEAELAGEPVSRKDVDAVVCSLLRIMSAGRVATLAKDKPAREERPERVVSGV